MKLSSFVAMIVLLAALLAGCSKSNTSDSTDANASASPTAEAEKEKGKEKREAREITIPAGTPIVVRLGESLSSKSSSAGQGFSGTVADAVVVDGRTVIKQGATAHGTVVDAKAMGHFKGGALLQVTLDSVEINGAEEKISTSIAGGSIKGKGKRSAVAIGGGAGVGAVLGGI